MKKFVPRIHYRPVTDTAGYPLSSLKGSREPLETTYDAFIGKKSRLQFTCLLQSSAAVMDAHEKAETLHRNVSLPNIILYRPEQGARSQEQGGLDISLTGNLVFSQGTGHPMTTC